MRKRIEPAVSVQTALAPEHWIDLESAAEIEITSEDSAHPIEAALLPGNGRGWKAAGPGKQTLRIRFDEPQQIRRIYLVFTEEERTRTQEFVLRWSASADSPREIVRQQYNFSPVSSEVEDYSVNFTGVKILELEINPAINGDDARATLAELRLG